jgi:hypothetical protein
LRIFTVKGHQEEFNREGTKGEEGLPGPVPGPEGRERSWKEEVPPEVPFSPYAPLR